VRSTVCTCTHGVWSSLLCFLPERQQLNHLTLLPCSFPTGIMSDQAINEEIRLSLATVLLDLRRTRQAPAPSTPPSHCPPTTNTTKRFDSTFLGAAHLTQITKTRKPISFEMELCESKILFEKRGLREALSCKSRNYAKGLLRIDLICYHHEKIMLLLKEREALKRSE
jgi:hypothetical protein